MKAVRVEEGNRAVVERQAFGIHLDIARDFEERNSIEPEPWEIEMFEDYMAGGYTPDLHVDVVEELMV